MKPRHASAFVQAGFAAGIKSRVIETHLATAASPGYWQLKRGVLDDTGAVSSRSYKRHRLPPEIIAYARVGRCWHLDDVSIRIIDPFIT
jgi:hypothetical protein